MLDIATAYNKYKFLGNEFLTWIWYLIETDQDISKLAGLNKAVRLEIGNSIVLENSLGDKSKEKISIKGDQAGLEEGTTALKKGAVVTEINLACRMDQRQDDEETYKFTIKGESFNLTGLKLPPTGKGETKDDIEGIVLEKVYLLSELTHVIDTLFLKFLEKRISDEWKTDELQQIRDWINT